MVRKVLKIIIDVILAIIITVCITLYVSFNFLGYDMYVVLSGSMEPTINIDDLVITKPVEIENVVEGDIITYLDTNDVYVTHRVVGISKENGVSLTMQGDNNNTIDAVQVTKDNIKGLYLTHISNGGSILAFLQSPFGIVAMIGIPVSLLLIWGLITYMFTDNDDKDDNDDNIANTNDENSEISEE